MNDLGGPRTGGRTGEVDPLYWTVGWVKFIIQGFHQKEVLASWKRLHGAHALVLTRSGTELLMANPFSAVPTPHRVRVGARWWYGNCAWDALGICAALRSDARVRAIVSATDRAGPLRPVLERPGEGAMTHLERES